MLSDRMPDLRALELLDAIARTGSITLAAGQMNITQQAASLRLRRLEQRIGSGLVARTSRSSRLTDDGLALLGLARPLLVAAAAMDSSLGNLPGTEEQLVVAASMTIAEYFLPRWISAYIRNRNDARSVTSRATNTREVIGLVASADVDLGFVEGDHPPPGLHYETLAIDELGLFVAPTHPWAYAHHISPWTLAATPLVTRESGSGCRDVLVAALRGHGVDVDTVSDSALELPSNTAVLEAAAAGVAPAVISTRPGAGYVSSHRLVRVRVDRLEFLRQLGAIWRDGRQPLNHGARELLRAARQTSSR